ncbi:hypothetical protein ACQ4PT_025904 [Festuca glaucescens]
MPDPWDLPGANDGEAAYFFTLRQPPSRGGGGRRRRAVSGTGRSRGRRGRCSCSCRTRPARQWPAAARRCQDGTRLHRGKGKARTDWVMHEYPPRRRARRRPEEESQ